MKKLLILLSLAGLAVAQTPTTIYPVNPGIVCNNLAGCYYHDLTATQNDLGLEPYAWFANGGYWVQLDLQAYPGQNPAEGAIYCPGDTGTLTMNSDGTATWTMTCTNGQRLLSDGHFDTAVYTVEVTINGSSFQQLICGYRTPCHYVTRWVTTSGSVVVTSTPATPTSSIHSDVVVWGTINGSPQPAK